MAQRGDAELASVMRKLLDHEALTGLDWQHRDSVYHFRISGSATITEDEAQAIEEAQGS